MSRKKCFIIAPISTPKDRVKIYENDPDHFLHVIEGLLVPAVSLADFEPVVPITKGSDLIHAEIVKNLQEASLVLCDMSCLNPNVFFELGIRTALNKPVCLIRDDKTPFIPFDLAGVNTATYASSVKKWVLDKETAKITEHIKASSTGTTNALWRCFGFTQVAAALSNPSAQTEAEFLRGEIRKLQAQVATSKTKQPTPPPRTQAILDILTAVATTVAAPLGMRVKSVDFSETQTIVTFLNQFPSTRWDEFKTRFIPLLPAALTNLPVWPDW